MEEKKHIRKERSIAVQTVMITYKNINAIVDDTIPSELRKLVYYINMLFLYLVMGFASLPV